MIYQYLEEKKIDVVPNTEEAFLEEDDLLLEPTDDDFEDEENIDLDASLVAQSIAKQIEQRAPFRAAQKKAIRAAMKSGAKGIKTLVSGRLNGVEMARSEGYTEGTVPLHTLRADIDYAQSEADTTYGKIGVKVWIYKDEVIPAKKVVKEAKNHVNAKEN